MVRRRLSSGTMPRWLEISLGLPRMDPVETRVDPTVGAAGSPCATVLVLESTHAGDISSFDTAPPPPIIASTGKTKTKNEDTFFFFYTRLMTEKVRQTVLVDKVGNAH